MFNNADKEYRWADNPKEKVFAEAWEEENVSSVTGKLDGGGVLDYLLAEDPNEPRHEVTDRDRWVAARVIQWLGSPCGQWFLRKVELEIKQKG